MAEQTIVGYICCQNIYWDLCYFCKFCKQGQVQLFCGCCTKCLILINGWWKTIFNATLNVYTISQLNDRCSKLLFWLVVVMWLIIVVEHSRFMCGWLLQLNIEGLCVYVLNTTGLLDAVGVCVEYSRFMYAFVVFSCKLTNGCHALSTQTL